LGLISFASQQGNQTLHILNVIWALVHEPECGTSCPGGCGAHSQLGTVPETSRETENLDEDLQQVLRDFLRAATHKGTLSGKGSSMHEADVALKLKRLAVLLSHSKDKLDQRTRACILRWLRKPSVAFSILVTV
jgi:hypothetical protein